MRNRSYGMPLYSWLREANWYLTEGLGYALGWVWVRMGALDGMGIPRQTWLNIKMIRMLRGLRQDIAQARSHTELRVVDGEFQRKKTKFPYLAVEAVWHRLRERKMELDQEKALN